MASQTTPAASTAPSKFSGSCLCGNVKYTITGTPSLNVVCHCINCKKASGSAFMANGMYKEEQLNLLQGKDKLKLYKDGVPDSGRITERQFCSECGSSLFLRNTAIPNGVIIPSGTLDDIVGVEAFNPAVELFCRSKASWVEGTGVHDSKKMQAGF